MPKIEIGEILEIPTRRGLVYGQYTHNNKLMGPLIRILPGFHARRPVDLDSLARQRTVYVTFFPVEAAARGKQVKLIGQQDVPPEARDFPLFRAAGQIQPGTGKVLDWWLWDGGREWRIERLEREHEALPLREVVMPPLLIERLEEGWIPRSALSSAAGAGTTNRDKWVDASPETAPGAPSTKHFIYFSREDQARSAAVAVQHEGYTTTVRASSDDSWLLLASSDQSDGPDRERAELERIARRFEGTYDGWEASVPR